MKYFTPGMSQEEAHKIYRSYAKTMHPDAGGDEEAFKELANEYATICAQEVNGGYTSIEEMLMDSLEIARKIRATIFDIYPRIPLRVLAGPVNIEFYFTDIVPFKKVLHITEIASSFKVAIDFLFTFLRPELKKRIDLSVDGDITYINMRKSERPAIMEGNTIYNGRRYTVVKGKKFSQCTDSKERRTYIMKNSSKLSIMELFNLESKDSVSK